ncbi:hypothetical protein [Blastococcus sp. SYSU D01042]
MRAARRVLPALALVLAVTACGGGDPEIAAGGTVVTLPPASTSPAAPSTPAAEAPEPERNERGNVPLEVGEAVAVPTSDAPGAPTALSFALEEFDLNPPCDSGREQAPVTENFLAWRMRVVTTPDYDPRALTIIQERDFVVLGPDGAVVPFLEGNAYLCLDQPTSFANVRMAPGQEYSGWLVLDVPVRAGTLVYAPYGRSTGWEWAFDL